MKEPFRCRQHRHGSKKETWVVVCFATWGDDALRSAKCLRSTSQKTKASLNHRGVIDMTLSIDTLHPARKMRSTSRPGYCRWAYVLRIFFGSVWLQSTIASIGFSQIYEGTISNSYGSGPGIFNGSNVTFPYDYALQASGAMTFTAVDNPPLYFVKWRISVHNLNSWSDRSTDRTMYVDRPAVNWDYQAYFEVNPSLSVVIDQKLSSNVSTGQVGRWEGGPNFSPKNVPANLPFNQGIPERLLAAQGIISNEKYKSWFIDQAQETDVTNHHVFPLSQRVSNLTAQFSPTYESISITTNLLDAAGSWTATVLFQDPWLIDAYESPYGMRNQGISAPWGSSTLS
jgi:hypothetical protein